MDKEKSTSGKCNQFPKFRFELIPWEMSLSNRQHMTETSPIEVKSLELPELCRSINNSDFIVTLDLQEKVKKLLAVFIPNRIFHQSTKQSFESEYFVHRTDAFDMEAIVLLFGRNFRIAALKSQLWLLERMKLKHCHVFIICHERIMKGVESLGIEVQLLLPFYANIDVLYKCSEVEMKLFERNLNKENVLIVTFDLNLLVTLSIDFKFKSYDVHHHSGCNFFKSFAAAKVNWTLTLDFFEGCLELSNMSKSNFDFFNQIKFCMFCDVKRMFRHVKRIYGVKRMYGDVKRMYGDVKRMHGDVERMHGDVERMYCDVERMHGDVERMYGVKRMYGDVERMHGDVERMYGDVERMHGDVERMYGVKRMYGDVKRTYGDVERMHGDVERMHGDVERMYGVKRMYGDVKRMHGDVERMHGDVERMHGDVERMYCDVERMHGDVERMYGVKRMYGDVERMHGDVERMYGDVERTYGVKRMYRSGSSIPARCPNNSMCIISNQEEMVPLFNHRDKYTHVVFLNDAMPGSAFSILQLKNFVPPVEPYCRFIHIGSSESYRNFVQSRFKVNERPFLQTFCNSNFTNIEQLISMVPSFPGRQLVLLSWNIEQSSLNIPEEYRIMDVSSFTIDENHIKDVSGDVTHLILVCGKLSESTHFEMDVVKAVEHFNVNEWMFVVCHDEDGHYIESVLLASNIFYLFSDQNLSENPRIDDITGSISLIKSSIKGKVPKVFLLTSILDRNIAARVTDSFPEYTVRHLDPMPWSSDSLSFTGSEFDRVVLLCDESVDPEARETISVLYTTLSRSKQDALIICHESKAEKMRDLLSLSSVDQVFEQLRSSVNLGENIFSLIQEEHQILEVFVKVIVTRNENQFNSLKCFITECDDPKFDWLFEFVRSMLLTCFSCGHETARMLNNFLLWKPSKQHPDQVLDWNDFCFLNYTTVEERKKILACIDPQFRSIRFEYKNLEISKLKTMAFTAVVWSQVDMLSHILDQLVKKGFNDRKFYDDLLFKIISMNDSNSLSLVLEKLNLFESDILSWLKATASFISQEMFSMLLSSIKPSGTSALDPKAILPLLASTTTVECFDIFLSFLSANLASFVLAEFRDDDGRNILMLAASNTEVFRLLLDRVSGECDINSLLSQRVNNACSCLRYASDADNIDVVRILVEEYSCNWVEDDVREAILSLVGHTGRNDIDIK